MASGDVDYDFFDTPRQKQSQDSPETSASKSPSKDSPSSDESKSSTSPPISASKPPAHPRTPTAAASKGKSERNDDVSVSEEDFHNVLRKNDPPKRTIEATLPTVGQPDGEVDADDDGKDDYADGDSFEDDDDDDDGDITGRRAPSPKHRPNEETTNNIKDRRSSAAVEANSKDAGKKNSSLKNSEDINKTVLKTNTSNLNKKKPDEIELDDDDYRDDEDDDIYDVSPLNTPHAPTAQRRSNDAPAKNGGRVKSAKSPTRRPNAASDVASVLRADRDSMDVQLLLKAMLEMEQANGRAEMAPVARATTTTMTAAGPSRPARPRKNYSFTNERVWMIDRENQRLMEKIMRQQQAAKKAKMQAKTIVSQPRAPVPRPTSASINRARQMQKIDDENAVSCVIFY